MLRKSGLLRIIDIRVYFISPLCWLLIPKLGMHERFEVSLEEGVFMAWLIQLCILG